MIPAATLTEYRCLMGLIYACPTAADVRSAADAMRDDAAALGVSFPLGLIDLRQLVAYAYSCIRNGSWETVRGIALGTIPAAPPPADHCPEGRGVAA